MKEELSPIDQANIMVDLNNVIKSHFEARGYTKTDVSMLNQKKSYLKALIKRLIKRAKKLEADPNETSYALSTLSYTNMLIDISNASSIDQVKDNVLAWKDLEYFKENESLLSILNEFEWPFKENVQPEEPLSGLGEKDKELIEQVRSETEE